MNNEDMLTKFYHYADEFWAEWDEGSQIFAEEVKNYTLLELAIHSDMINMNLASIMVVLAREFKNGEREHDDLVDLAKVMTWIDSLE